MTTGREVIELRPDVDWDKGKTLLWVLDHLPHSGSAPLVPIYLGDDITDEDAFDVVGPMVFQLWCATPTTVTAPPPHCLRWTVPHGSRSSPIGWRVSSVSSPAGNVRRGAAAGDTLRPSTRRTAMWFALVNPEMLAAAATDLGGIRSGISAAYARPLR